MRPRCVQRWGGGAARACPWQSELEAGSQQHYGLPAQPLTVGWGLICNHNTITMPATETLRHLFALPTPWAKPRPIEFAPLGSVCMFNRLLREPLAHQYFKHRDSLTPLKLRNEYRPAPPPAYRGGEPGGIQGRLPHGSNALVEPWRAQDGKFCKAGAKWKARLVPHQSRERIYQVAKFRYTIWGTRLEDMGASGDVTKDHAGKVRRNHLSCSGVSPLSQR